MRGESGIKQLSMHLRLPRPHRPAASFSTLPLPSPAPPARLPAPRETKQHQNPNPYALTPYAPSVFLPSDVHSYVVRPLLYTPLPLPLRFCQKRSQTARYHLDVGAYGIPKRNFHTHPDPHSLSVQIGEDAYFIRSNAMGVADGVGGWARTNPHPTPSPSAIFAKRLMHYTSLQLSDPPPDDLESHLSDLSDGIDVLTILERAYDQTVRAHVDPTTHAPIHTGSSTALVAVLEDGSSSDPTTHSGPHVKVAQIGDGMGMLIRDGEVVWRSEEMWWGFNMPVQLAPPPSPPPPKYVPFHPPPPPSPAPQVTPRTTAHLSTLPVRPDDILLLASDGLSDNLWDEDVLDEVLRFRRTWPPPTPNPSADQLRRSAMAGMLSEALCSRARRVSEQRPSPNVPPDEEHADPEETPFSRRARQEGKPFRGGKRDDISVLVAIVAQSTPTKSNI